MYPSIIGVTPPGMPGTHPQYFGWGSSVGIYPDIITYFKFSTSEFTNQNMPFRDHKTKEFLGRGTAPRPHPLSPNLELALTPLTRIM